MKGPFVRALRPLRRGTQMGLCILASAPSVVLAEQATNEPSSATQASVSSLQYSALNGQAVSSPQTGLEDIIVTARRSNESAQRVPIAITTVTAQALKDLSVRDVIEIQKITPGLYISSQNSAGRAKLSIRGQSEADSRLTTDGSVGVYVDGVNFTRSYGLRASLVDVAQIEVLKGPQGTLFGKNTTGGALNITTQHPTYDFGGYVDALYGSYNNRQILGVLNIPLAIDKAALRLVGQAIKRDGYGRAGNGQGVGDDNTIYGRALLRLDPVDDLHILLSADYVRQNVNGTNVILTNDSMLQNANSASGDLGEIAKELGLNPTSAVDRMTAYHAWRVYFDRYSNQYKRDGIFFGSFGTEPIFSDLTHYGFSGTASYSLRGITFKSITSYRRLVQSYNQDLDGTPFELFRTFNATRERNFTQELQLSSIDGRGLDWQGGLFYNRETGNELQANDSDTMLTAVNPITGAVTNPRSIIIDIDAVNSSKAAYAQAVYNVASNLRLTGGIRYTEDVRKAIYHNRIDVSLATPPIPPASIDKCTAIVGGGPIDRDVCRYPNSASSSKVTWLASIDWRPARQIMVYASASRGYRTGGFSIRATNAPPANQDILAATFSPFFPEVVTSYETGFKSDLFDRRLRVNAAAYLLDYKDIQVQIRGVVNNVLVLVTRNAASARPYGGELEMTGQLTPHWTVLFGGAYLHAKYTSFTTLDPSGQPVDLSNQPFAAPKWTYNIGTTYARPLPDGEIRLNLNWQYTSTVDLRPGTPTESSVTQPGYGLLDARISWNIDSLKLNIAIFGKNLLDKRYLNAAVNLQSRGYNGGYTGDPRTFGVQVRKSF